MRQLTLIDRDAVEWLEVPEPRLASQAAAIVRPIAVGVCDFDRRLMDPPVRPDGPKRVELAVDSG